MANSLLFSLWSGLLCVQWKQAQKEYHCKVGSRKSKQKWAATLATKLIELTNDMWKWCPPQQRQLYQRPGTQHTKRPYWLHILRPSKKSTFFSHVEQRFFRKSDKENLKKCKLHKKRQWIRKANTILRIYRRRQELNPQTQTLYYFEFFLLFLFWQDMTLP